MNNTILQKQMLIFLVMAWALININLTLFFNNNDRWIINHPTISFDFPDAKGSLEYMRTKLI